MTRFTISFAGAGNVAGALCRELHNKGYKISQIVSLTQEPGKRLAKSCGASWSAELNYSASDEIIIVAVPDHELKSVLGKIRCNPSSIIVHTAGSFGTDIFPSEFIKRGVLYPLQTFSKERKVDFSTVPFLIEASDELTGSVIQELASSMSNYVRFTDLEHRLILHIAAVFVSNFTNHMFTSGKKIALKAGFSFEVLKPLIIETVSKALESGPENSQTGPAIRYDMNTIEKHLYLLSFSPEMKNIYNEVTKSIISNYKKNLHDE